MQGAVLEGHLEQAATCLLHGFLHGNRDFAGLALAHADTAIAIAHHAECGGAHGAVALDDLAYSVDANHFFTHAVVAIVGGVSLCSSHDDKFLRTSDRLHARLWPVPSHGHENGSPSGRMRLSRCPPRVLS